MLGYVGCLDKVGRQRGSARLSNGTSITRGKDMLERLARWSFTHRWRILVIWIVVFVAAIVLANVASVADPYQASQGERQISDDGKVAFARVEFTAQSQDVPKAEALSMEDMAKPIQQQGVQIDFGGDVIQNAQQEPPGGTEAVGL